MKEAGSVLGSLVIDGFSDGMVVVSVSSGPRSSRLGSCDLHQAEGFPWFPALSALGLPRLSWDESLVLSVTSI